MVEILTVAPLIREQPVDLRELRRLLLAPQKSSHISVEAQFKCDWKKKSRFQLR